MEFRRPLFLLLVLFSLLSSSQAHKFYVGGNDAWVPNPSEDYNQWAGRNRFQVNDILVFKYNKVSDSVLEVKKEDYDKCNRTSPIKKFEDGDTEFKFDRTGPFYFISGKDGNCEKGQKLIVVVLSVRVQQQHGPPPKEAPSPVSHPPVEEPPHGGGGGGGSGVAPVSPFPNPPSASPPALPPTTLSPSGNPPLSSVSPSPAKVNPPSTSPFHAPGLSATSPSTVSSPPVVSLAPVNSPSVPSRVSTPLAVSPGTANIPSVPSPGSAPVPATTPPPSPSHLPLHHQLLLQQPHRLLLQPHILLRQLCHRRRRM